jgi:hypothetical protein
MSNIPNAVCAAIPEDEQIMLETCRGPWFSINWMKSASRWFHHTDQQRCETRLCHSVFQRKEGWQSCPTTCLSSRQEKRLLSTGILTQHGCHIHRRVTVSTPKLRSELTLLRDHSGAFECYLTIHFSWNSSLFLYLQRVERKPCNYHAQAKWHNWSR